MSRRRRPTSTSVCMYLWYPRACPSWSGSKRRSSGSSGSSERSIVGAKPGASTDMDASLRQGQLDSDSSLDVPFAGRAVPAAQARQGREVPVASRLGLGHAVGRPRAGWLYNVEAPRPGAEEGRAGVEKWQTRGAQNRRARKGVRVQLPPPVPPSLTRPRPAGNVMSLWGCSSVGRAQGWQSWGQGFDSPQLHQITDAGSRSHLRPRVCFCGAVKIRTANSPARVRTAPPTAADVKSTNARNPAHSMGGR